MKTLAIACLLLLSQVAFAEDKMANPMASKEKDSFTVIHAADLATMMKSKKDSLYVFDANTDETRKKEGVIPGATILASHDKYDVAKVLPPNKDASLVFYCANTQCSASHSAANRASKAGYKHVSVMSDGIQGWKKAGNPSPRLGAS